jgi:hypothetical protein
MQELALRVGKALTKPWSKPVGRPKSLGLYRAVEVACMYLRQNGTEEFLGDLRDISQSTAQLGVRVAKAEAYRDATSTGICRCSASCPVFGWPPPAMP